MTIKALTISQPYASLIASGEKWVENRRWYTRYRGYLAIHAGCGTQYLSRREREQQRLPIRGVIAIARLVAVVNLRTIRECCDGLDSDELLQVGITADDLLAHEHTEGPYCWVLQHVTPLDQPVPIAGKQGLWDFEVPPRLQALIK